MRMSSIQYGRCLCAAAILAVGCGDTGGVGKTVSVKGKVLLGGAPLTAGTVVFTPDAGSASKFPAAGSIGADGTYTLGTGTSTKTQTGAVPGKYKVTVNTNMPPMGAAAPPKPVVIDPIYSDPARTPLSVVVSDSPPAGAIVKTFICPSDTSLNSNIQRYGYASTNYAANLQVLDPCGPETIVTSMPDGTSLTVLFTERFKVCAPSWGGYTGGAWAMHPAYVGHGWDTPVIGWRDVGVGYDPSFNNTGGHGNYPFQVAPAVSACDWYVGQSAHTSVMMAGLGDGSIRAVRSGLSQATWNEVGNPKDGVVLGTDW